MSDTTPTNNQLGNVEYASEDERKFVVSTIETINRDLEAREKASYVFNGMSYSDSYEYNIRKALNYSPPRGKEDREVSVGIIHEKMVSFVAIFLKYIFKPHIKAFRDGQLVPRMGDAYELAVKYSQSLEEFRKKIALIYWEMFSQGDCFVYEDWQVRNITRPKVMLDGQELDPESMDYTYEFLEGLDYEDGEEVQTRLATSVVMDGRKVILADPELDEGLQAQPHITLEESMTREDAALMFDSLTRWDAVPEEREQILEMLGDAVKTLFENDRCAKGEVLVHKYMDKERNRFNIFVNGVMMLPYKTPFTLFYPRNHYPLSQFSAERLTGSAYSRSIPAKTKFNADYLDWMFKKMALRFEQGIEPAILAKGKYTLTRDIFKAGQVTHGVTSDDFEKADPDNNGVTQPEFNFFSLMKEILEAQTVNQTTSGELSANATATEITTVDHNQQKKLAFFLDGMVNGYYDLVLRRCETFESKFTRAHATTLVDGEERKVYQNFAISVSGVQNIVMFDDTLEDIEDGGEEMERRQNEMFKESYKSKEAGNPTEKYMLDPAVIRRGEIQLVIEIKPEQIKESQLQMIQMFNEFQQVINLFGRNDQGGRANIEEMQKEYLQTSGRSEDFFVSDDLLAQDPEMQAMLAGAKPNNADAQNFGSFGKPKISDAVERNMVGA